MSEATPPEPQGLGDEQRDELVEEVAREIQLRGLTTSAVHFLLADEDGIEQLIERLEDLSEETGWDA